MARGYPDFEGDKQAVYLQSEFAAKVGTQKTFRARGLNVAWDEYAYVDYAVPAGKTLYITWMGFEGCATLQEDADNNQVMGGDIYNHTTGVALIEQGGNGGGGLTFPTPPKIVGGDTVRYQIVPRANHNMDVYGDIGGYEI